MSQRDPKFRIAIKDASRDIRYFVNCIMYDISKEHNCDTLNAIEDYTNKQEHEIEKEEESSESLSSEGG